MNQQTFKNTRISSCSTKKSSSKPAKSQSKTKKNLQSTFTKMSIPNPCLANSSVLTQRINTHDKCKACFSNPQNQNTVRVKQSSKKLPKAISQLKIDRKAQYAKLKAKQIESQLEKKPSSAKKSVKKASVERKAEVSQPKTARNELPEFHFAGDLGKISKMIQPESENFTQIKRHSDQSALSEISKNQKQLIEKIASLERQNQTLSQKNDSVINEIKYKYDEQVLSLKDELKVLNCRLNQQNNKNQMIEKKSQISEKEYASLRERLQEKDQRISFLENHNKSMEQELKAKNTSIRNYVKEVQILQSNLQELRSAKIEIEERLKRCEKEKLYIKQNCTQVLSILREEFGEELKLLSF